MNRIWIYALMSTLFWQASCNYIQKPVPNKSRFTIKQQLVKGVENIPRVDKEEEYVYTPEATVYFDYNQSNLKDSEQEKLNTFYEFVIQHEPNTTFFVEGNTDTSGTQAYNLALSERRANEVIRYLVYLGADAQQFEVIAQGELNPIADDNEHPELNRRATVYSKERIRE